jgi:hypothetical protein
MPANRQDQCIGNFIFYRFIYLKYFVQYVDKSQNLGWDYKYKLALVVMDKDRYTKLRSIEIAMASVGYDMKLFRNKRSAKKWLLS